MNVNTRLLFCASLLLTAAGVGCSGGAADRPKTYPAEGQVLYNGKPVEGAYVSFWAEEAPRAAEGTTDKDGKFKLSMFELNDGAMAGENKVVVSKLQPAKAAGSGGTYTGDSPKPEDMTKAYLARKDSKTLSSKDSIPQQYASRESTPLKFEVKAGANDPFMIQITD
jgi:hypothetical protein